MAFRFSTNLSVSDWASSLRRTFPTACCRDLQHFAVDLFSKWGPRRRKSAWRCLFARKTNKAKTATRKRMVQRLYPSEREGSKPPIGQTHANKTVAKAKWPKSGALLNDPHPKAGSAVARRPPLNSSRIGSVAINRGSSPRRFGLNLWSFDPACVAGRSATRNISKHSGFAVPRARLGIYIAKRTPQKPTLQTAQGRHVRLNFSCNTQSESRDSIGCVARAIWTAEKPRSQPTTRIALEASRMDVAYYARVRKLRHPHSL